MISWFDFGPVHYRRWRQVQMVWSLSVCALLAVTWKLWIFQNVFPQVPAMGGLASWPAAVHGVAFGLLVLSSLAVLAIRHPNAYQRLFLLVFLLAALLATGLDQHRLQPWFYQSMLVALAMIFFSPARALPLLRALLVSIYLFSALGKFDYQFLHTVGPQFVGTGCKLVGVSTEDWPVLLPVLLSALFPVVEFAGGVGLLMKRFRRAAIIVLITMHLGLLLILGPLGLNHQPAVLLWNVSFIFQVLLLFGRQRADDESATTEENHDSKRLLQPSYLFVALLLLPLLEPLGCFDHWLSWGLYSPRNSRVTLEIYQPPGKRLPVAMEPYVRPSRFREGMVELRMDRWSLEELGVPIYPQDRFQLGVAAAAIEEGKLQAFVITVQSMSERFSGERQQQEIKNLDQLEKELGRFWINAHPRP
jgi:hypothetical protein